MRNSLFVCRCKLLRRHTQLSALHGACLGQLFCAQTELTSGLCSRCGSASAHLTQLPSSLRRSLLPRQRTFKGLLRTLRCTFKPSLTHLRCRATLLFQDISSQLLFGDGLTRAAKGARTHSLRRNLLPFNIALPRNVLQSLLHSGVFILTHERSQHRWVIHCGAAPQGSDSRSRGTKSKRASPLKLPLRFGRGGPRSSSGFANTTLTGARFA